jgi:acetoin utilization deacetylase AcuC-like enzyme
MYPFLFCLLHSMPTAIAINARHAAHDEPRHVEQAARLAAVVAALDESGLRPELLELPLAPASEESIRAVHQSRMIELVRWTATQEGLWLDQDTYTTVASWDAALHAAGCAVSVTDAVVNRVASNGFALARPPGHHATAGRTMGFCLFNNVAVAARHALDVLGLDRVAIVDYDVHHGNGTQDIFYAERRVLFCSTHASPLYPGTGYDSEIGAGDAVGTTLNIPLPHGAGDAGLGLVFDELISPALRRFAPQMIFVSAGYDGHWSDPLGPLTLSASGYAALTRRLIALADELCEGRVVLVLEGGYNLQALGACVVASLEALLGRGSGLDPLGRSEDDEPDLSAVVARIKRRHPLLQAEEGLL